MTCVVDAAANKDWLIQWDSGQVVLPWMPFVFCDDRDSIELSIPQGFHSVDIPEGARILRKSADEHLDFEKGCFTEAFCSLIKKGGTLWLPESPLNWLDLILSGQESSFLSALKTWIKTRRIWHLGSRRFDLNQHHMMGIWNVDPASFSSHCEHEDAASLEHAMRLIRDGADILDVGAESTRPGAEGVSIGEEIRRLTVALPQLSDIGVPVSLDCRHFETIHHFLERSMIDIVNDIGESEHILPGREVSIYRDVIEHRAGMVMMAWLPHDSECQSFAKCIQRIVSQLAERLDVFFNLGGDLRSVVVDPGIGFGKGLANDFRLIFEAPAALMCLGCPVLIAHSRKRCLAQAFQLPLEKLDIPTAVMASITLKLGASLVRVHDVAETKSTIVRYCQ